MMPARASGPVREESLQQYYGAVRKYLRRYLQLAAEEGQLDLLKAAGAWASLLYAGGPDKLPVSWHSLNWMHFFFVLCSELSVLYRGCNCLASCFDQACWGLGAASKDTSIIETMWAFRARPLDVLYAVAFLATNGTWGTAALPAFNDMRQLAAGQLVLCMLRRMGGICPLGPLLGVMEAPPAPAIEGPAQDSALQMQAGAAENSHAGIELICGCAVSGLCLACNLKLGFPMAAPPQRCTCTKASLSSTRDSDLLAHHSCVFPVVSTPPSVSHALGHRC